MATIQGIYVALFGRPADPAGLAYWNSVTNNGQDLSKLIGGLTSSKEYTDRFIGQSQSDIITSIYQTTFGHAPDPAGLSFFLNGLQAGTFKIESLAISILDGAQGSDRTVVSNKVAAADLFTTSLDTPAEIAAFNGKSAADIGVLFLSKVTSDPATIPTVADVNTTIRSVQTNAGQAPAGGDGSAQPDGPTTLPNTYKVNDSVTPHKADGYLLTGTGNPNTGFAVTTNPNEGIELGLSLRYRYGETATNGVVDNSTHVVKFNLDSQNIAIAYSVSDTGGIDLEKNTYKLVIDPTPSSQAVHTNDYVYILQHDATDSGFSWILDFHQDGQITDADKVMGNFLKITDDSGSSTALQNIQPVGEMLENAGTYDISVQASENNSGAILGETHIQLVSDVTRKANDSNAVANQAGYLYVGHGNSSEHFTTATFAESQIVLGIAGKFYKGEQHIGTLHQQNGKLYNDGLVHYTVGATDQERFVYSVESQKTLDQNVFKLMIDKDPGQDTDWIVLTLTKTASSSNGVNSSDSQYSWSNDDGSFKITDDGGDADGHVTQNTENFGWFDTVTGGNALLPGHYDVILQAYEKDGTTLIGSNHVVFDVVAA